MGSDLMARYAAEAQAEAKAEQHDSPKPARRGDYAAQAILDYRVLHDSKEGASVQSNRLERTKPTSR
jgi:hypothetical protein